MTAEARVATADSKAYALPMSKNSKSSNPIHEGHMRLIALLLYVADQKQKSLATMEQLFSRLMRPKKD
jgi:hypothetical protein